ncbi:MAG: Uma2 family endonuclease [Dolichospermum sp. BR01]|jgi:Uma2 family endonuclease|nr:Uma2 family endonuclease [Dolichospermum sp. BR01]
MIAEVLSTSTKSYDKDEKFAAYRTIPDFQEYILIDQYTMHVEQYSRTDHNKWIFSEHSDSHDSLNLAAIACQILLEDIYDKVDFEVNK